MAENIAKHMLTLKDSSMHEIMEFLDAADVHGGKIRTTIGPAVDPDGQQPAIDRSQQNVSYEARQLKSLYIKLME